MQSDTPLFLVEECLLLALHDDRGTVIGGVYGNLALGAALLGDLLLGEHIVLVEEGKKIFVEIAAGAARPEDPLLREGFERIRDAKRRAQSTAWVSRLHRGSQLRHEVAASLCRRRVLKAEEKDVLLFFKKRTYPERDARPERALLARLDAAIRGRTSPDPRTAMLAAIAYRTNLLKVLYDRKQLKSLKPRLEAIADGDALSRTVKKVIEAVQAAVTASMIATTVTTT